MKITFDFNPAQTDAFKAFLSTGLIALDEQSSVLTKAMSAIEVDGTNDDGSMANIQNYLNTMITPQQLVVAEIMSAILEAEKPRVICNTSIIT